MKKYKLVKKTTYKERLSYECETKEIKVPLWWFEFLQWLFIDSKELVELDIEQEKERAFYVATETARSMKEDLMQRKLRELGYELKWNFPQAKEIKDGDMPSPMNCSPNEIWSIEKVTINK